MENTDYREIKIYDKVIIVESKRSYTKYNQGFVVEPGNEKMLKTANDWAVMNPKKETAPQHEYDNGDFKLSLFEAADYSSCSGRLSFWNCIITAPDGKEFLIGINATILINLMKATTFVNGECSEKVWLGRIGGNQVGAFIPSMEEYTQAEEDKKRRASAKTTVYKKFDIITDLRNNKEMYLGEIYSYGTLRYELVWVRDCGHNELKEVIVTQPRKQFLYYNLNRNEFVTKDNKASRIVVGSDEKKGKILMRKVDNYNNYYKNMNLSDIENSFSNILVRTDGTLAPDDVLKDFQDLQKFYESKYLKEHSKEKECPSLLVKANAKHLNNKNFNKSKNNASTEVTFVGAVFQC